MAGYFFPISAKKIQLHPEDISRYRPISQGISNIRERERNIRAKPETRRDRSSSYTDDHKARCLRLFAGQAVDATEVAPTLILIYG